MNSWEDNGATVPFETVLNPMLQDPEFIAYYLIDALKALPDEPQALVTSLQDVIKANSSQDHFIKAFGSVALVIEHLTGSELSSLIDFIEEVFPPNARIFYASHGTFQIFRDLAQRMNQGETLMLVEAVPFTAPLPEPKGLQQAVQALKVELPEITRDDSFQQMRQTLSAA